MSEKELNTVNKKWLESWMKDPIFKQKQLEAKKRAEDTRRILEQSQKK